MTLGSLRKIFPGRLFWAVLFAPFWMELVLRGAIFGGMFCERMTFLLPLSLSLGCVLALPVLLVRARSARPAAAILLFLLALPYCAVTVYFAVFGVLPSLYSAAGAGQVMQFWRETLAAAWRMTPWLVLYFLPFALSLFSPARENSRRLLRVSAAALSGAGLFALAVCLIASSSSGAYSPRALYFDTYLPMRSAKLFGAATAYRQDAKRLIAGDTEEIFVSETPPEIVYDANVMDFDFTALAESEENAAIRSLHQYFAAQTPTAQNEYTGLFKGKNLVLITAEGWSPYAVSEDLTPTLYRMLHEGFVFENYYNPLWGVSTTDGEYAACVGLLPKAGIWSFQASAKNLLPFCMGNQLASIGYSARAYHDHFYDYYRRDLSHPNMGYVYKGYGNGLRISYSWPESDLEMIEKSSEEFIGDEPFLTYYMTVSGHLNYTFLGNSMATRHRDLVEDLPLSESAQAYIACNYELELAMTELLARLEAAGEAENTVFCITPDHYPYGLDKTVLDELAGETLDETFGIYKSCLVLWSPSMEEPVLIEKPCAPLDILPTLSNLFGLEYDSRLLMGRDILSDAAPLVIFNSRSWITDQGRYDADHDVFTPAEGANPPEDYAAAISQQVDAKFTVSARMLDLDYYRVLWQETGKALPPVAERIPGTPIASAPKETPAPESEMPAADSAEEPDGE